MKPIIFDFITKRTIPRDFISFKYNGHKGLNTVSIDGCEKPYIDLTYGDLDLQTKTKIHRESDDDNLSLADFGTKTKYGEKEDLHDYLLEFQTKTLKVRERDE